MVNTSGTLSAAVDGTRARRAPGDRALRDRARRRRLGRRGAAAAAGDRPGRRPAARRARSSCRTASTLTVRRAASGRAAPALAGARAGRRRRRRLPRARRAGRSATATCAAAIPAAAYQTVFAREPGSAEMPSAGRPFTAGDRDRPGRRAAIAVAPILLHTGVSSQDAGEPPQPERFRVPRADRAAGQHDPGVGRPRRRGRDDRHPRARERRRRRRCRARERGLDRSRARRRAPGPRRRRPGHRLARTGRVAPAAARGRGRRRTGRGGLRRGAARAATSGTSSATAAYCCPTESPTRRATRRAAGRCSPPLPGPCTPSTPSRRGEPAAGLGDDGRERGHVPQRQVGFGGEVDRALGDQQVGPEVAVARGCASNCPSGRGSGRAGRARPSPTATRTRGWRRRVRLTRDTARRRGARAERARPGAGARAAHQRRASAGADTMPTTGRVAVEQRDQRRPDGHAAHEVLRAVDGIDHPATSARALRTELFAGDRVVGTVLARARSRIAGSTARSASVTGVRSGLDSTARSAAPKRCIVIASAASASRSARSRSPAAYVRVARRIRRHAQHVTVGR